eukprot:scaffold3012_cov396-Prasinococcus_capsulatus_cf.AAC.5
MKDNGGTLDSLPCRCAASSAEPTTVALRWPNSRTKRSAASRCPAVRAAPPSTALPAVPGDDWTGALPLRTEACLAAPALVVLPAAGMMSAAGRARSPTSLASVVGVGPAVRPPLQACASAPQRAPTPRDLPASRAPSSRPCGRRKLPRRRRHRRRLAAA